MKIFLSALENAQRCKAEGGGSIAEMIVKSGIKMKYNLMSFFYIQKKTDLAYYIRDHTEEILIDSGAHSFQKGIKVDWLEYTKEYASFIQKFDKPNVIGYFEMDVDNIIGYDHVLELRKILESVSDKIIPVWHKNRGIDDFKRMCETHRGKVVAITGFKNEDVKDDQYILFVKYARKYGCRIHCLGMTRKNVLDKVPFDYTDSSSWSAQARFGRIGEKGKVTLKFSKENRGTVFLENYKEGMRMQEYYHNKWKKVNND